MPPQPMITGTRHMMAAGHYLATQAGHAVLEGGNAIDAPAAAGIALGMVHSDIHRGGRRDHSVRSRGVSLAGRARDGLVSRPDS